MTSPTSEASGRRGHQDHLQARQRRSSRLPRTTRSARSPTGTTKVIVTDDGTINCDNIDTTPTCLDVPEGVDSLVNVGLSFYNVIAQGLADASDKLPGLKTTQDEVAGRKATCAEADSNAFLQGSADSLQGLELPSMNARICVDNETGTCSSSRPTVRTPPTTSSRSRSPNLRPRTSSRRCRCRNRRQRRTARRRARTELVADVPEAQAARRGELPGDRAIAQPR